MLEKNKDYVEMKVSSTDCAFTQNEPTSICIDGYVYTSYMNLPDPGEFYILISKEKFERLQANVGINEELAKQWEINYNLLLKKTGFDTVEELVNYIHDNGPNSQMNWETLKEIIDDAEEDYISERDKAEELQKENEQLKKKLNEFDPVLERFLKYTCGGQVSVSGWEESAKFWNGRYKDLVKLVGFSSKKEVEDYLVNEAECNTLYEAISKLKDQVKYTCEEWYSANSRNNSWKAAAECNSPKELIEKLNLLRDDISGHDTVIESYECNIKKWQKATGVLRPEDISAARALQEWKDITGCPSPSAAKTLIESGMSYVYAYHEVQKENRKLTEEVDSWKNVTGYSTPEDFLSTKINKVVKEVSSWEEITGFSTPEKCSSYIDTLEKKLEDIKDLIEED